MMALLSLILGCLLLTPLAIAADQYFVKQARTRRRLKRISDMSFLFRKQA